MEYVDKIVLPFINKIKRRLALSKNQKALCIFDVFRGQMGEEFLDHLKQNNICIVFVPANCTDKLQPMDLSVQKSVKDRLKSKFQAWYSNEILKQVEKDTSIDEIQPVDLKMSTLKPLGADWLVQTYKEIAAEPDLVYNGFHCAGIAQKLNVEF